MEQFYSELRNSIREISEFNETNCEELVEKKNNQVVNALKVIMLICEKARKEGLLALDEYARRMFAKNGMDEDLFKALLLVMDGTDPSYLEDIMMMRYYTGNYAGYDALTYFIYMKGMLYVQKGMNPIIIEESLVSMLPRDMEKRLVIKDEKKHRWSKILSVEDEEEFFRVTPESFEEMKERFCKNSPKISFEEEGALNIMLANYIISELDDRSMQRVMREIDDEELEIALRGLDSSARIKIITNLSQSLANIIMETSEAIRWTTVREVGKVCLHIVSVIVRLCDTGELDIGFSEKFEKIVREIKEIEIPYEALDKKKHDLHNVMREYISQSEKKRYL